MEVHNWEIIKEITKTETSYDGKALHDPPPLDCTLLRPPSAVEL